MRKDLIHIIINKLSKKQLEFFGDLQFLNKQLLQHECPKVCMRSYGELRLYSSIIIAIIRLIRIVIYILLLM
jgi:uncharacterized protein YydD (DUF2326 family)